MAEIFSTAAAVAALLEQCFQLCSRVRAAVRRQKGLPELIDKFSAEIRRTKVMIELVQHEPALRTPNIGGALTKLSNIIQGLSRQLQKMAAPRSRLLGLIRQLTAGRRYQEALEGILKEMAHAKADLGVYIQLVNVGLTRSAGDQIRVSTVAIDAVNQLLQEKLGSSHKLRISRLIEGRPRNDDETVELTLGDIAVLSSPPGEEDRISFIPPTGSERTAPPLPRSSASRTIKGNEVSQYALQVNTPIGQDIWENVANVRIEGNRATDFATQLNYPTSVEAFLALLQARSGQLPVAHQR